MASYDAASTVGWPYTVAKLLVEYYGVPSRLVQTEDKVKDKEKRKAREATEKAVKKK